MRQSRLHKFKKQKAGMLIFVQLVVIYCLSIYGLFEFTSPTNASFNDIESLSFTLKAADDFETPDENPGWDKSSLEFIQTNKCENGTISAIVKNGNDSNEMKGSVTYEVYFAEKGNPKNGASVASGEVQALDPGETLKLTYKPNLDGNYMFRAEQRSGHPGKGELWSKSIQVNEACLNSKEDRLESKKSETRNDLYQKQKDNHDQTKIEKQLNPKQKELDKKEKPELKQIDSEKIETNENEAITKEQLNEDQMGADNQNENNDEMD